MTNRRVVEITEFGGPSVLKIVQEGISDPAEGEAQVRQTAIGFNFIDIYQRKGIYPLPLPTGLGFEAAGIVEAVGEGVDDIKPGQRVAYMNAGVGAYADRRNVPADKLVQVPDDIDDETAATVLFKGMTAQYLLRHTHAVQRGDLIFVHSAAGGVGQILTRWATALGARVVGGTGSPQKRQAALDAGCIAVVDTSQQDWPDAFLKTTEGERARVVYDAVGKDTLLKSLDCAAPFGLVVIYGASSGKAPAIDPELLNKKGCLFLTRPSVFPHNADLNRFRSNAADLFNAVAKGHVSLEIGQRFALEDIAEAHRAAEERRASGAIVTIP
ncbi:quinone oxidoreductase family protein [Allomesorhizobium alhagi]|uniref:Zinc-containing alcohol dehydrogenase superfamily protein n=1 Tax=Mesorhizobium alhagi CCNWXJ12-2 TaxID=1107882 RepID=H0HWU9_9HYPH|nr:quinone oxidoreductase [Mesorhizobium alhagi]EHK54794.1 zinc-containing alcohol dehydrogenase superfamily protein [Mesorhizobium alhagi CCNWXJ12-2]